MDEKTSIIETHNSLQIFRADSTEYSHRLWEFFSLISFAGTDSLPRLYEHLDALTTDSWQSHLIKIARAKLNSVNGRLFRSYTSLIEVQADLEFQPKPFPKRNIFYEVKAFHLYEKAILAIKIGDLNGANNSIQAARDLTEIQNFKLAIKLLSTQLAVDQSSIGLNSYIAVVKEIESIGLLPLACLGWRVAGIIARDQNQISRSREYTSRAFKLADENDLGILFHNVLMSKAVSALRWGEHEYARELFAQISNSNPNDVQQAIINENLAVIEQKEGQTEKAISLIEETLPLTLKLDHIVMVPAEAHFLGEQYEHHHKDLDQAEYYYRIGYEHATRYAEHGISLTGDRKAVVDAYMNLLRKKSKSTPAISERIPNRFSFAEGKSWKQIRDIFQHQLILFHSQDTQNRKQIARTLNMPPTTLYSLQSRLEKRGYLLPAKGETPAETIEPVQDYIEEHDDLSWTEINEIFEREMMHYLYEKYGYNKQRMATILELSYPALLNKTREITQVDDHLLPN